MSDDELKPVVIPAPYDVLASTQEYEHPTITELVHFPEYRAELVETLRASAELLRADSPFEADFQKDPAFRVRMQWMQAKKLLEAAQGLCDHARIQGRKCRYCEAVISQPKAKA
jgi:hypothetical protein